MRREHRAACPAKTSDCGDDGFTRKPKAEWNYQPCSLLAAVGQRKHRVYEGTSRAGGSEPTGEREKLSSLIVLTLKARHFFSLRKETPLASSRMTRLDGLYSTSPV